MHLECFIRGEIASVSRFLQELSSKYLLFRYNQVDEKGNFIRGTEQLYQMRVTIRTGPLGLYEIVFPEEHRDLILNTLFNGKKGEPWIKWMKKYITILRKLLKLQPIPDYDKSNRLPLFMSNMEIIAIGLKEDKHDELSGVEHL